jgi:hypothetical protein
MLYFLNKNNLCQPTIFLLFLWKVNYLYDSIYIHELQYTQRTDTNKIKTVTGSDAGNVSPGFHQVKFWMYVFSPRNPKLGLLMWQSTSNME